MKNTKRIASILIIVAMIFSAIELCPVASAAKGAKTVKISKNYTINGGVYLKYSAKYSKLTSKTKAAKKINKKIKSMVSGSLKQMKKESKTYYIKSNGDGLFPYVLNIEITLTSNNKGKYSFKSYIYRYSGGAHGYAGVSGLNYSKKTGKKLSNSKLTKYSNKTLKKKIVKKVKKEINKNPVKYFDDALDTVKKTKIKNFNCWIKGSKLHVYFGEYVLSPYMAGPTEITIKL